jgi:uncharacterized Zn-binding protein involved in type VI secretion
MGAPAIVQGNRITGTCPNHLVPSGTGTAPAPPPVNNFSAPVLTNVVANVLIGGKPAAVAGSSGFNNPPHPGIVDGAFTSPTSQVGQIVTGSATVFIGRKAAATTSSQAHCCLPSTPGKVGPGVPSVLIG